MLRSIFFAISTVLLFCNTSRAEMTSMFSDGLNYKLITPSKFSSAKKPLLLLLHGCKQSADIILEGTQLEAEAQKRGFAILVPEQPITSNIDHCWNWFYAYQQDRNPFTEMGSMISTIESIIQTHNIDRERIYVAGMSAGGALAHSLMACYPDYFSGVAIQSGLAYKVAENIYEANTVLTADEQKPASYLGDRAARCSKLPASQHRLKKVILIHGQDDTRVLPLHHALISATNEVMRDVLDDGRINQSPIITSHERVESFENGYSATIKDKSFGNFKERSILVKGMQHAWGGGKAISKNFDPEAPSTNEFILSFFKL